MATMAAMLRQLEAQRDRTHTELERLDKAIDALRKLNTAGGAPPRGPRPKRRLSAAARKRISAAQKARWAKVKKQKKQKVAEA